VVFGVVAVLVSVVDQAAKYLVAASIPLDGGIVLIPGYLNLVHARNAGAAFGLLARSEWDLRGAFFVVVSLAAVAVILWLLATSNDVDWRLLGGYSLFFGGALGNLIDRIRFGEVIDFLDVHVGSSHWPAFNLADSALCIGTGLFVLHFVSARHEGVSKT
jgi:signal peptidase II